MEEETRTVVVEIEVDAKHPERCGIICGGLDEEDAVCEVFGEDLWCNDEECPHCGTPGVFYLRCDACEDAECEVVSS
ncbi:MAG: hypothetical protein GY851_07320 [bacterium]|nr:hypothetical protein [bacterium]